jgi:trehalose 6-phosphate phosphatase
MAAIIGRVSLATALHDALGPLLADPSRSAVLLDVDGTLAPIVRHADDAHVPEPTRAPLIKVARGFGLVACVSGRRAAVARRIVSLGSITYVGNHGAELLRGGSTEPELFDDVARAASAVRAFGRVRSDDDELRRLRVRFEDKDVIVAFHWRGAPDEAAAEAAVRGLAADAEAEGLVTHWGRKVLEVRPAVELHKGRGVERLLAESGAELDAAMYVGDDRTDVDAFRALRDAVTAGRLGSALCVGVASDETPDELAEAADLLVHGTAGVRAALEALAAAL